MAIWKKSYSFFSKRISSPVKKIRIYLKQRFSALGIPMILTYRSFGNENYFLIRGCVLEDKGLEKPERNNSVWENIVAMLKRYTSDEIPGIKVLVRIRDEDRLLVTDESGVFETIVEKNLKNGTGWMDYEAEIISDVVKETRKIRAKGEILFPNGRVSYGIISDVDDTILVSHSTKTIRKLQLMLLRNAYTRKPFPGVAAFYQSLHKGLSGNNNNPVFYVSSSEWNLYDLLDDFCSYNHFPKGIFLLRDLDYSIFQFWKSGGGNHLHKYEKIKTVFNTYPQLSFILVGDNGQRDPYIYLNIAKDFPGRVKAVYIRSVVKKHRAGLKEILEEYRKMNIDVLLVKNTYEAAVHASKMNFIPGSALIEISRQVYRDIRSPGEITHMANTLKNSEKPD